MKFCALVLAAVFCAALLFAEETPESIAKSELPSLLTIYKDVYQDPELFDPRTADLRADREGTESRDGLVVLVRTDMDALPEQEETGLLVGSRARLQSSTTFRKALLPRLSRVTPQALVCWWNENCQAPHYRP